MAGTGPRFKLELGGFQPVALVKDLTDGLWRGLVLLLLSYIDRTEGLWLCREHGTGTDWQNNAVWPCNCLNLYGVAIWTDWVHSQSLKIRWCFKSKPNPPPHHLSPTPAEPWKEDWKERQIRPFCSSSSSHPVVTGFFQTKPKPLPYVLCLSCLERFPDRKKKTFQKKHSVFRVLKCRIICNL